MRVGIEGTGYSRWFERLLAELSFGLWIGGPAEIKAERVKKQKFDRDDARLLRRLMLENKFPQIWILIPSPEDRDRRQLLWHRHRLLHRPPDPARLLGNLSHKLSGINESLRTNCRH